MLCVKCDDGKKKTEESEPTGVVEVDRRVRESQNLVVSCTDFVHAWSPCGMAMGAEVNAVTCPVLPLAHSGPGPEGNYHS